MTQDEIQAIRAIFDARRIGSAVDDADIDSLEAEVIAALDAARGKAEPVAWQRRHQYALASDPPGRFYKWEACTYHEATNMFERRPGYEYRPLYAHPPAPDAARGDPVAQVVEWLRKENGLCDCHARCETECGCGAWDDWKTKPLLEIADAIERGEPFNG